MSKGVLVAAALDSQERCRQSSQQPGLGRLN